MRRVVLSVALAAASLMPMRAFAQRVRVRVVDVAAGRAYVSPGSSRGIRRGTRLRFGRRNFEVVGGTSEYAVVEMGEHRLRVGARGTGRAQRDDEAETVRRLPEPQPLETFRGRWTEAERPASAQDPDFVPLAASSSGQRVALSVSSSTGAILPFDGSAALIRTELRGRVRARLLETAPLHLSADAAIQLYFANDLSERRGGDSRPLAVVRQLTLSYGEDGGFYAALGRLRRASSSVGLLDGARVVTPTFGGGFRVAAFGGGVPDPDAGLPGFGAVRFGIELGYTNLEVATRPSVSVVAHGSTFDGGLDEKRLSARVRVMPGAYNIGAYGEASFFAADNPFGAPTAQLSVAGADVSGRHGGFHWTLRGDYRVPERSLWLASFLPAGYLCVGQASDVDPASTTCSLSSDARYSGGANAEMRWAKFALPAPQPATSARLRRTPSSSSPSCMHVQSASPVSSASTRR